MRKKFLQGVLTLGMAAAICFGASAVQAEAAITTTNIEVSGEEQTLTIKGATDEKEILVGFAKQGKKSGKTTFKVASWDIYEPESGTVTVDLSNLNSAKDNFVEVKYLNGDIAIIKIPAAAKKCVASYDASKDELEVKAGDSKSAATAATSYEYRTTTGSWTDGETLASGKATAKFEKYQPQGATLYLRIPGAEGGAITANADLTDVYEADNVTEDSKIPTTYQSVSLPSKEVKLKIAKQANSPKVPVNYVKGEVTLPANTEYRIAGKSTAAGNLDFFKESNVVKITKNTSKSTKAAGELLKDSTTQNIEGFIEVRTAADTTKKKAASKWMHVDLKQPVQLTDSELKAISADTSNTTNDPNCVNALSGDDTNGWKSLTQTTPVKSDAGGTVKYGGCGVKNATVTDGAAQNAKDLVTVKYGTVNAKNSTGQVILENKGDKTYQVVVKESRTATIADTDRPSTLKAGNGKSLTLKNLKTGQWIFIREAGVQKTKEWVGVYKVMGVVDIPLEKVVEKAETPTT